MRQHVFSAAVALQAEIIKRLFLCRNWQSFGVEIEYGLGATITLSVIVHEALVAPVEVTETITTVHTTDRDDHSFLLVYLTFRIVGGVKFLVSDGHQKLME